MNRLVAIVVLVLAGFWFGHALQDVVHGGSAATITDQQGTLAALDELRALVDDLHARIDEQQGMLDDHETKIDELESEIARIDELEGRIDDLEDDHPIGRRQVRAPLAVKPPLTVKPTVPWPTPNWNVK